MKHILLFLFFLPGLVSAQNFTTILQDKLDSFYESYMPLNVHLLLNQPEYAAGDTVFFKVDLVTAQGHRPVAGKSILTISLLDHSDKTLCEQQFSILNGQGSNQIILPANIPVGHYFLAVTNSWMTESNSVLYKKPVRIGTSTFPAIKPSLEARPEGGILVAGLTSRIAIAGSPFTTGVLTENGEELSTFSIGENGTTWLALIPKLNSTYKLESDGLSYRLPAVQNDGVGIQVTPSQNEQIIKLKLSIRNDAEYLRNPITLVVSMHGVIHQANEIKFNSQSQVTLDIPTNDLPEGVLQFSVFDTEGNVLAERLYNNFKQASISAKVMLPKKQFNTRDKIDLQLQVLEAGNPVSANFAATVFHARLTPLDTLTLSDLPTDLALVNDAGYQPIPANETRGESLDNRMILTPWSRFNWKTLAKRNDNAFYSQYMNFRGEAFDALTKEPLSDSTKLTFFLQRSANTYEAYVIGGKFNVTMLFEFIGEDEIFYRAESRGRLLPQARVSVGKKTLHEISPTTNQVKQNSYADLFEKRKIINQSYSYHSTSNAFLNTTSASLEDDILGADVIITMSDYQLFPTMVETLREVMPFTQHRSVKGKDVVRIYDRATELFRTTEPVYVIDGVMTDDTKYFLSLNPADIITLKLIHDSEKLNAFGLIGKGGLLLIETKIPGNAANVPRGERSLHLTGLTKAIVRGTVSHSVETLLTPDLRTNLLWLPKAATDNKGNGSISFFASDVPGQYKLIGEGITKDGKLFVFETQFEVIFAGVNADGSKQ